VLFLLSLYEAACGRETEVGVCSSSLGSTPHYRVERISCGHYWGSPITDRSPF
jgi:hypothetical protein